MRVEHSNRLPALGLDHLDRQHEARVVADDDRDAVEALEARFGSSVSRLTSETFSAVFHTNTVALL